MDFTSPPVDFTSPPLSLRENGFSMVTTDPLGTEEEDVEKLKEELETWKEKVAEASKAKADLLCANIIADQECADAEKELMKLRDLRKIQHKDSVMYRETLEERLRLLYKENSELKKEIAKLKEDLAEHSSVQAENSQIKKKVAEMKLKFSHMESMKKGCSDMDTHGVFDATAKIPFRVNQNQALLTFDDEEVAQRLTKKGKHFVSLDSKTVDVKAVPVTLEMGIKFELHVTVSGKKICVSEIPDLPIPEDWMRDKLELNFSKTEQGGGGEVEDVTYDRPSRSAVITFRRPGASSVFVGCTKYPFFANGRSYKLSVSPSADLRLKNCQPYCGVSKKTILLKGIQETEEEEESIQDMIEIHFQKPSNGGGEIEKIKYVSKGAACVCFEEDTGNAS